MFHTFHVCCRGDGEFGDVPPHAADYRDVDDSEYDDTFHDDDNDDDDDDGASADRRRGRKDVTTQKPNSQTSSSWPSGTVQVSASKNVSSDSVFHYT